MPPEFYLRSVLLSIGLAMDAFSVSLANGLRESGMRARKMLLIAGTFAFFQFLMPMIGWFCVHAALHYFQVIQPWIPWIAFALLLYIGGGMIREGCGKSSPEEKENTSLTFSSLLIQGIATSIDALSAGFTIAEYTTAEAFVACLLIAAVTLGICIAGVRLGRLAGTHLSQKASILGGIILILIGLRVLLGSLLT